MSFVLQRVKDLWYISLHSSGDSGLQEEIIFK
jgi:hypothetical protein